MGIYKRKTRTIQVTVLPIQEMLLLRAHELIGENLMANIKRTNKLLRGKDDRGGPPSNDSALVSHLLTVGLMTILREHNSLPELTTTDFELQGAMISEVLNRGIRGHLLAEELANTLELIDGLEELRRVHRDTSTEDT